MNTATRTLSHRIPGLDGLRGIAVLLVILSHASIRNMYLAPGLDFSGIGKSGVYLFFVLSAMLLASQLLTWDLRGYMNAGKWFRYFQRRVFRIWPLFILALLVSLATTLYGPAFLNGRGVPAIITSESFLPALLLLEEDSLLWTIAAEFKFYFLLPAICFILYALFRNSILASLMFLIPLTWIAHAQFQPVSKSESPLPFLTLFLAGIMCAVIYQKKRTSNRLYTTVYEILGWLFVAVFIMTIPSFYRWLTGFPIPNNYFHESHLLYAGVWAAIILFMLYGSGLLRRILESAPLVYAGKISYSLYLWHLCIYIPVYRGLDYGPVAKGWIAITGAILLASLSYYLIEQPTLRWSASLGRNKKPSRTGGKAQG